jgi:hypothetical protein
MNAQDFDESIVSGIELARITFGTVFSKENHDYNTLTASSEEVFTKMVIEKRTADFFKLDEN